MADLTADECRTLLTCLDYSLDRMRHYPHPDYDTKRQSMKPLEEVHQKLRALRDAHKGE